MCCFMVDVPAIKTQSYNNDLEGGWNLYFQICQIWSFDHHSMHKCAYLFGKVIH